MTMVALPGHPAKSASPSHTTIISKHGLGPHEPTTSYTTSKHSETNVFSSTAVLRDIPTDVPTTAATLDDDDDNDDDDRCRSYHPSNAHDAISTIDPTFLQEWDAFYTDFRAFVNSTGASTSSTNEHTSKHEPAGSIVANNDPPAAVDLEPHCAFPQLEVVHSELPHLLHLSTTIHERIIVHTDTTMTAATSDDRTANT